MADIAIQIDRFQQQDGSYTPAPHRTGKGNTEQRYRVFYNGEELGVWRYPEHAAARKLIAMGYPRDAVLHTFRGSTPSMHGSLGWWVDHTIREDDVHGLHVVKYRPSPFADTD